MRSGPLYIIFLEVAMVEIVSDILSAAVVQR